MRPIVLIIAAGTACTGADKVGVLGSDDTGGREGPACLQEPMSLELGTGEVLFKPLVPGGRVEVIHGTQDGHHILGSMRIWNVTDIATIHYTITTIETGERISDQVYRLRLSEYASEGDCARQAIGMYGYLGRIDPGTATFLLEANLMEMTVTNVAGESASASIEVYPYVDAIDHGTDTGAPTSGR